MGKTELLAPAGSLENGKVALYNGADALYLALESFGARAYAKNFTIEELDEILNIAHSMNKKIYVTVNTIIKNSELESVYKFLDLMYVKGVDAIICADIAVFMYVINNLKGMDAHISTQVGVKDLYDTKFFERLGASRVVLAREDSIEEIKYIKENSNVELEIFIHGALCVSYSGGCLFSSLLSLRSGNRGRCSQNCRREYIIYENDKAITNPGFFLSLKDLCVGDNVKELVKIGIDSLKIEGRMKNVSYVDNITKYYRDILDKRSADFNKVDQIFHRQFTKGFIFGEDKKNIATIIDASSQGKLIGKVIKKIGNKLLVKTDNPLRKGERIRFFINDDSKYLTVDALFDLNNKKFEELKGEFYIQTILDIKQNSLVFKMQDNELNNIEINSDVVPLNIFISGSLDNKIYLQANINDDFFVVESDDELSIAKTSPITNESVYKQLNKLVDTPFFIETFDYQIDDGLFITVSQLNELRRKLIAKIYDFYRGNRTLPNTEKLYLKKRNLLSNNPIVAHVKTQEQYDACKNMGIDVVFFDNVSPYVNSKYNDIDDTEVLVGNYGGLYHYENKIITTDYSFNVMNKDSILHLLNLGAQHVTLSYEITQHELKELAIDFYNTYGSKAPIDMIIYGKTKLMTMKYCPLKRQGLCGKCKQNKYHLVDKFGKFLILPIKDCYVEIYNDLPLNLINEVTRLTDYVDRFRLEFVDETVQEVIDVISNLKEIMSGNNKKFTLNKQTSGYFKRSIM